MSEKATNNLLTVLQVEYRREMNEISDHMSTGGCSNIEEYQRCVGTIQGLAYAERLLLDLDERMSRE